MIIQKPIGDAVFYPSDPETLQSHVENSIHRLKEGDLSHSLSLPLAIISPHAAYTEVSTIMGNVYTELQQLNPKHIVLMAPLHGDILQEDAGYTTFYPEADAFHLPGFTIPIDQTTLQELDRTSESTTLRNSYFEEEPAIELQLPYIHYVFGEHPVIPLLVGNSSSRTSRELAKILRTFNPGETLFIVSTNLTGDLPSEKAKTDADTAVKVLTGEDNTPLLEALKKKRISMCGTHIIESVKKTGYFADNWTITGYHTAVLKSANRSTYSLSALLLPKDTEGNVNK